MPTFNDVIHTPTSAIVHNGSAVVGVDKQGNSQVLLPEILEDISLSGIANRLQNRFDDITYYSN